MLADPRFDPFPEYWGQLIKIEASPDDMRSIIGIYDHTTKNSIVKRRKAVFLVLFVHIRGTTFNRVFTCIDLHTQTKVEIVVYRPANPRLYLKIIDHVC